MSALQLFTLYIQITINHMSCHDTITESSHACTCVALGFFNFGLVFMQYLRFRVCRIRIIQSELLEKFAQFLLHKHLQQNISMEIKFSNPNSFSIINYKNHKVTHLKFCCDINQMQSIKFWKKKYIGLKNWYMYTAEIIKYQIYKEIKVKMLLM